MKDNSTRELLIRYAEEYETSSFINGDPSWFMHQVEGETNQEVTAFVAASLSYGSRSQFLPKIQWLLDSADGNMSEWLSSGNFSNVVSADNNQCFYRMPSRHANEYACS